MFLPIGWWVCVSLWVPGRPPAPPAAPAELAAKLDRYVAGAASTLDPRPRALLGRIRDRHRRMLAFAHYLRLRDQVDSLWTWSDVEARAHQHTDGYRDAMAAVRGVKRNFAELNPGYVLVTDTVGRPLRTQLRFWNREPSVAAAAQELEDSGLAWLAAADLPDLPDSAGLGRFMDHLLSYQPDRLPTVAVPGLSLHGRLRAFDFAVLRRGRVVATTASGTIDSVWDRGGWAERLREAVAGAGGDLAGPMETPREPWHYEYRPEGP
jgi:hypothetical protein